MNKLRMSVACATISLVFFSCRTISTGPDGGNGNPLSAALIGSSFHFTVTETDTMGNSLNVPSHQTDSVIATGITWQGKSNVIKLDSWDDQGNTQIGYYALLDNGDVALYLGPLSQGIVSQWLTFPFTSGGPVSTTIEDLSQDFGGGNSERVTEIATYSHGPDTTIMVKGTSLVLKQVIGTYVETTTETFPGFPTQTTSTVLPPFHYYWATAIGFAGGSRVVTTDAFGEAMIETQTLTSYELK